MYRKRISSIGVLTTEGIEDVYIVEGNVNGAIFLQRCLLNIKPFDGSNSKSVVIFDNASIHHLSSVVATITAAGALVRFLPPYSPDFNPIEEAFSKVKAYNQRAYHSTNNPWLIVASAFTSITKKTVQTTSDMWDILHNC